MPMFSHIRHLKLQFCRHVVRLSPHSSYKLSEVLQISCMKRAAWEGVFAKIISFVHWAEHQAETRLHSPKQQHTVFPNTLKHRLNAELTILLKTRQQLREWALWHQIDMVTHRSTVTFRMIFGISVYGHLSQCPVICRDWEVSIPLITKALISVKQQPPHWVPITSHIIPIEKVICSQAQEQNRLRVNWSPQWRLQPFTVTTWLRFDPNLDYNLFLQSPSEEFLTKTQWNENQCIYVINKRKPNQVISPEFSQN